MKLRKFLEFLEVLMLRSGVCKLEGKCQGLKKDFCQRIMDLWPRVEVKRSEVWINWGSGFRGHRIAVNDI